MSRRPIDRSPELKKLRDEGYDVSTPDGYLVLRDVPYLNAKREIRRGVLIAALKLTNDVAQPPDDHQVKFVGEHPCNEDGSRIHGLGSSESPVTVAGFTANWNFSCKPKPAEKYDGFHHKMTHYVAKISGPAQAVDPSATAQTFRPHAPDEEDSVFLYEDTASSRADIVEINNRVKNLRIGIVGLGGTGSYVLDLVSKSPVKEIHLFDGDIFEQHNAFRAPGAASGSELEEKLPKVEYYARIYQKMRRGIVPHPAMMDPKTLEKLAGLDFVFLCMEGKGKRVVVEKLEALGLPFIDVGMGVVIKAGKLRGQLRTTTSTPTKRDHVYANKRIAFATAEGVNEYDKNIQIVVFNAINATQAVLKWLKLFGVVDDDGGEHSSVFVTAGAETINEDND